MLPVVVPLQHYSGRCGPVYSSTQEAAKPNVTVLFYSSSCCFWSLKIRQLSDGYCMFKRGGEGSGWTRVPSDQ